jgi:predicted nucleotidyltransferase
MTTVKLGSPKRNYDGILGIRHYINNRFSNAETVREKLKQRFNQTNIGISMDKVSLEVFDQYVRPSDKFAFTKENGYIWGRINKDRYQITKLRSPREGWMYAAKKLTEQKCGTGSIYRADEYPDGTSDTKYGVWYLRDETAAYIFRQEITNQLSILLDRELV